MAEFSVALEIFIVMANTLTVETVLIDSMRK